MNHFLRTVSSQLSHGGSRRSFSSGGYGLSPSEEEKVDNAVRKACQLIYFCLGVQMVDTLDKFVCTMRELDQRKLDHDRAMAMAHELEEK